MPQLPRNLPSRPASSGNRAGGKCLHARVGARGAGPSRDSSHERNQPSGRLPIHLQLFAPLAGQSSGDAGSPTDSRILRITS